MLLIIDSVHVYTFVPLAKTKVSNFGLLDVTVAQLSAVRAVLQSFMKCPVLQSELHFYR